MSLSVSLFSQMLGQKRVALSSVSLSLRQSSRRFLSSSSVTATTTATTTTNDNDTTDRHEILAAYRRLCRARNDLFAGDQVALRESRVVLKHEFTSPSIPSTNLHDLLQAAREAEDMLRHGIVQGKLNPESGHYQVKFEAHHAQSMDDLSKVEPITGQTVTQLEQQQQHGTSKVLSPPPPPSQTTVDTAGPVQISHTKTQKD